MIFILTLLLYNNRQNHEVVVWKQRRSAKSARSSPFQVNATHMISPVEVLSSPYAYVYSYLQDWGYCTAPACSLILASLCSRGGLERLERPCATVGELARLVATTSDGPVDRQEMVGGESRQPGTRIPLSPAPSPSAARRSTEPSSPRARRPRPTGKSPSRDSAPLYASWSIRTASSS